MENKVQLITYIDRLGGENIPAFIQLMQNEFHGLFGGVHLLPFFFPIDGADAGFDPIDHQKVDPRLGNWDHIRELSVSTDVMADLIVNHVSAQSEQFNDFLKLGKASAFAQLFLTLDSVFPGGVTEHELVSIYRPRPGLPFTSYKLKSGETRLLWTTFTANQIDIDVQSKAGQEYLENILSIFESSGIKMIRLDAAGYAIKERGTRCFMTDKTFDFIGELTEKAHQKGIVVLVEIHSHHLTQIEIANKVDYVYDFALPVLVLDTLFNHNADNLKEWLKISPRNAFTVLDTHDGIGIIDVASEGTKTGLIDDDRLNKIVEQIHINSNGDSLKSTGVAASNLDLYQINCTYYDALAKNDTDYLIARAIQFFVPGIPQVYYMGLLAGENDMDLLESTKVGRDINRHYYTKKEIRESLQKPVVKKLIELIQLRNNHPAFLGEFSMPDCQKDQLVLQWNKNYEKAVFDLDLKSKKLKISFAGSAGTTILQIGS
jgi:sucrose phosphorylase